MDLSMINLFKERLPDLIDLDGKTQENRSTSPKVGFKVRHDGATKSGGGFSVGSSSKRHGPNKIAVSAEVYTGLVQLFDPSVLEVRRHPSQTEGALETQKICEITERKSKITPRRWLNGSCNQHPNFSLYGVSYDVATRARAHSSQGQGRVQIVVEPPPELPFETAQGSQGGAKERGAGGYTSLTME
jgi:hypothetical protein